MEEKASSIAELFDVMIKITREFDHTELWWRGQSNADWNLASSIYHQNKEKHEKNFSVRFKNTARVRHHNCPSNSDISGWLFLMQHYGLPTRLLDWTKNILIAVFFAVENEKLDGVDGAIWALAPTLLNKNQAGNKSIFVAGGSGGADQLMHQAFLTPIESEKITKVYAIHPDHRDIRHLIQASMFTAHGTSLPINKNPELINTIRKIIIPKGSKGMLRQSILLLGISRSYIFPDLENLAKELSSLDYLDQF